MKLTNRIEIVDFLSAIKAAKGEVWLESIYGDRYNLKSALARYVAIDQLLHNHTNELELFCQLPEDDSLFFEFFAKYPEVLE